MLSAILCGPHVLAVHLGNIDLLGLLRLMRMLGTAVNTQIAHLNAAERTTRDHALDRLLQHALGETTLEDLARGALLDMADIAGVLVVGLLLALATGQHGMRRVDDDDIVAAIDVRRVRRKMFAAQPHGDQRSEAADHDALGVDQHPLLRHLGRLCRKRFHLLKSWKGKPARETRGGTGRSSRDRRRARQRRLIKYITLKTMTYNYGAILPCKSLFVWNGIGRRDMGDRIG